MSARVLVVCTANICRSPAAAMLLAEILGPDIRVESAGARALVGAGMCRAAAEWVNQRGVRGPTAHVARQLDPAQIQDAVLVLTAGREHRAAVVRLVPGAQRVTFTLPQAARIAAWRAGQGRAGAPKEPADLLAWLVDELDAGRGLAPRPAAAEDDDLPDAHEGVAPHAVVLERIEQCMSALRTLVR